MNKISDNLKQMTYKITLGLLLLGLMTVFSGCFENYGRLRLSKEVDQTFEKGIVMPDYKYYYSGGDARPWAILGIHKNYKLQTSLWKEVDLDSERLKNWILFMTEFRGYQYRTFGSRVLDPEGKQIGIWYSAWFITPVKMLGGNEVAVYPPVTGNSAFNSYLEPEWRNK
jgi:hypothetical protein